jgi:hypothetical protein
VDLTLTDVFHTGCVETVYNVRVAEFSTYFVGGDEWGFSVWAHNACAKVYWYRPGPGDRYGHLSVETTTDAGRSVHTDRVPIPDDKNITRIRYTPADYVATSVAQCTIPLPDGDAAQAYQERFVNTAGGVWSLKNNCFTYVADVLLAGGVPFASEKDFLKKMSDGLGFDILKGP